MGGKSTGVVVYLYSLVLLMACESGSISQTELVSTMGETTTTRVITGTVPNKPTSSFLLSEGADRAFSCIADAVQFLDSKLATTRATVDENCLFSGTVSIGKAYTIQFMQEGEILATLHFASNSEGTKKKSLFISTGEHAIDLGNIRFIGDEAISANNPLDQVDEDGDGDSDANDFDDDGDGLPDVDEEDCDNDGIIDDHDETSETCEPIQAETDFDDSDETQDTEDTQGKKTEENKPVADPTIVANYIYEVQPAFDPNNMARVDVEADIVVRVNCPVDVKTVNQTNFSVVGKSESLKCLLSVQNRRNNGDVVCAHTEAMRENSIYTATVKDLTCTDGKSIEGRVWNWTTAAKTDNTKVSFLAFGDWGTGGNDQKITAAAMVTYCRDHDCDFVQTLGDNFYPNGVSSVDDPQWETKYRSVYKNLGLPFYVAIGNHDLRQSALPQYEYARIDPSWHLPNIYYLSQWPEGSSTPILEIFVIDSINFSAEAEAWLKSVIANSKATWKILTMHYPIFGNRPNADDVGRIKARLLPIICGRVDLVVTGHEHQFVYMSVDDGGCLIEQITIGTGGAGLDTPRQDARLIANGYFFGFGWFQATHAQIKLRVVKNDGTVFFTKAWTK